MCLRAASIVLGLCVTTANLAVAAKTAAVDVRRTAEAALAAKGQDAEAAVARLRAVGQRAMPILLEMRDEAYGRSALPNAAVKANVDAAHAIEGLIDRVAGQRYACVSKLFWHTDLDAAKAEAARSGKPILSLRMLGKLTDEFSCANSRFFRTTLYANEEISKKLRDEFVLHWKSVRPVPKVTIDFGDGRKLERTVTGNSAHYVLTADGQPLDVLPGLYGPQQFVAWLTQVHYLHEQMAPLPVNDRAERLAAYHAGLGQQAARAWARDLLAVAPESVKLPPFGPDGQPKGKSVREATQLTASKAMVEMPIVRQLSLDPAGLTQVTTEELWTKIAALPAHKVRLDKASQALIERENPNARLAGARAMTKRAVEDPLLQLVSNLRTSIAADTVKNEYTLHRQVHDWFANRQAPGDFDQLNERVYAELFLTPSSDPWLGLAPTNTYTALNNGGVVQSSK
jgi:hypothetical protein